MQGHCKCRRYSEPVQKLTLQIQGEQNEVNSSGVATKFLVDLQRFVACRKVMQQEHMVEASLGATFKVLVAHSKIFSGRTNLLFRSNVRLRTDDSSIQSSCIHSFVRSFVHSEL